MKKNPVMFVVAIAFLVFIAAIFIYNNFYPKISAPFQKSSKLNYSRTSIPSEESSKNNHHKTSAPSEKPLKFGYPGPPAFSLDIPTDFRKGTPRVKEGQLLTGKTITDVNLTLSVFPITKDISMEDNGSKTFRPRLAGAKNLKIDDVKIVSNEKFELDDGTTAWKCQMEWPFGSIMVTTYLVTADKDGKRIIIAAHTRKNPTEAIIILGSLTLK